MRSLCLITCLVLFAGSAFAQEGLTYMRTREHVGWQGHGGFGYGQPFYGNYYSSPFVVGSWYARPYPTHLDYFRLRGTPVYDYPCADMAPPPPEVVPAE